jgi:hypothetical protein
MSFLSTLNECLKETLSSGIILFTGSILVIEYLTYMPLSHKNMREC